MWLPVPARGALCGCQPGERFAAAGRVHAATMALACRMHTVAMALECGRWPRHTATALAWPCTRWPWHWHAACTRWPWHLNAAGTRMRLAHGGHGTRLHRANAGCLGGVHAHARCSAAASQGSALRLPAMPKSMCGFQPGERSAAASQGSTLRLPFIGSNGGGIGYCILSLAQFANWVLLRFPFDRAVRVLQQVSGADSVNLVDPISHRTSYNMTRHDIA